MKIGKKLKLLRRIIELSQAELGELIECSIESVRSIEQNRLRLSSRMAHQISLATGVDAGWLLEGQGPPTSAKAADHRFTRQVFDLTRQQTTDPRTTDLDLFVVRAQYEACSVELRNFFLAAYAKDQLISLFSRWRHFRESSERALGEQRAVLSAEEFRAKLRELRDKKLEAAAAGTQEQTSQPSAAEQQIFSTTGPMKSKSRPQKRSCLTRKRSKRNPQ